MKRIGHGQRQVYYYGSRERSSMSVPIESCSRVQQLDVDTIKMVGDSSQTAVNWRLYFADPLFLVIRLVSLVNNSKQSILLE